VNGLDKLLLIEGGSSAEMRCCYPKRIAGSAARFIVGGIETTHMIAEGQMKFPEEPVVPRAVILFLVSRISAVHELASSSHPFRDKTCRRSLFGSRLIELL
jgi:hypothetical protein